MRRGRMALPIPVVMDRAYLFTLKLKFIAYLMYQDRVAARDALVLAEDLFRAMGLAGQDALLVSFRMLMDARDNSNDIMWWSVSQESTAAHAR